MQNAGVPCSSINTVAHLFDDAQVNALEMIKPAPSFKIPDFKIVDVPVTINGQKALLDLRPPALGSHTDEVLRWAGFTEGQIASLRKERAVS
jgi:crotonobetainyl-CoA:carnitine CoA-transferase CaiB-like acyl-CoA transferase